MRLFSLGCVAHTDGAVFQRRMKGGPAGLRRAYQDFCDDGSGVITYEMFRRGLAHKLMIDLDDELWDEVMLKFDTGRCAPQSPP